MKIHKVEVHDNGTEQRYDENGNIIHYKNSNGYEEWYINRKPVSKEEFDKHTIVIDGKSIQISDESYQELKKALT